MSRPRRTPARVVAVTLAALATACPATAQDAGPPTPPADGQPALDPQFFDLIRRTLEETRAELLAVEPGITPEALRGRLLVEALQLINNVTDSGVDADRLLTLPGPLREDAARLVALVLGEREPPGPPAPRPGPGDDGPTVPARIRPFEGLLTDVLRSRFEELARDGDADPAARLEAEAPEVVARAACPSNDPRDLSPDERAFAVALARRIASGGADVPPVDALQDDLDALAELLRRRDAELRLAEGVQGIEERARRLEQFGLDRLEEAIRQRDPAGTIPESARDQVRAMANLVARGVPFPTPTDVTDEPPDIGRRPDEPGGPTGEVTAIDPGLFESAAGLARAVDRGLIAAGVDLATRRATLRRFFLEWVARKSGATAEGLPPAVVAEADRLVEQILSESPPTVVAPPTVVTVPVPPVTVPTVTTPIYVLVPGARHRWCPPWK